MCVFECDTVAYCIWVCHTGTHAQFSYGALVTMLLVYFAGACCAMGTAVSAGVVVPMLLIGGCYGRIVGKICVATLNAHGGVFIEGAWERGAQGA